MLQAAISGAETGYQPNPDPSFPVRLPGVPAGNLGVASHPYSYLTPYDPNFALVGGGGGNNPCFNLNYLIGYWRYSYFPTTYGYHSPGLIHVVTEDNYSSDRNTVINDHNAGRSTNKEGAYLMDVLSYMYDYLGGDGQWGYPGGEAAYPFNLCGLTGTMT